MEDFIEVFTKYNFPANLYHQTYNKSFFLYIFASKIISAATEIINRVWRLIKFILTCIIHRGNFNGYTFLNMLLHMKTNQHSDVSRGLSKKILP